MPVLLFVCVGGFVGSGPCGSVCSSVVLSFVEAWRWSDLLTRFGVPSFFAECPIFVRGSGNQ